MAGYSTLTGGFDICMQLFWFWSLFGSEHKTGLKGTGVKGSAHCGAFRKGRC